MKALFYKPKLDNKTEATIINTKEFYSLRTNWNLPINLTRIVSKILEIQKLLRDNAFAKF